MSFAIFQRNSTNGALRMSNFTGKLKPLAAASARACTTTLPSFSTNAYFVGVLREPNVSGSQPVGRAAPGFADEKGVTSGAASIRGCASAWLAAAKAEAEHDRCRGMHRVLVGRRRQGARAGERAGVPL